MKVGVERLSRASILILSENPAVFLIFDFEFPILDSI